MHVVHQRTRALEYDTLVTCHQDRGAAGIERTNGRLRFRSRPFVARLTGRNYWTVMLPFMFIAACGMHT